MRFGAFLVFAALWSVLVYAVMAHWAFGGGWLIEGGTLDFAGGVPVEMGSGFSALAAALVVGARKDYGRQALLPHNAVYVLLGAGLLWFGWFGFNGGSGFSTGDAGVLAFTNTLLCPACTLVAWFVLDLLRGRKVTAVGAATAIIVGCVGITPAGGYVSPGWAMALGFSRGPAGLCRDRLAAADAGGRDARRARRARGRGLHRDPLHRLLRPGSWNGVSDGLVYGNAAQLGDQALAALAAPMYAFVATFLLLKAIGLVMPLRATERQEALGLDVIYHGEEAYPTGEGAILVTPEAGIEGETVARFANPNKIKAPASPRAPPVQRQQRSSAAQGSEPTLVLACPPSPTGARESSAASMVWRLTWLFAGPVRQ